MSPTPSSISPEGKVTFFQFVILILSVVVLAALLFDTFAQLPPEAAQILQVLDTAICGVFMVDFAIRFHKAKSKLEFMKWGWIDLLASIPNLDFLRWGRLVRVLRIIRLLRGIRSFHRILSLIFQNKLQSGLGSVALTTFLLISFSSVSILMAERSSDATIKTAEDAVWWSVTTITTVGYGDKYPITLEGRIIAMVLMVAGVGLFGTLSGLVASYFLAGKDKDDNREQLLRELESLHRKLDELREKVDEKELRL